MPVDYHACRLPRLSCRLLRLSCTLPRLQILVTPTGSGICFTHLGVLLFRLVAARRRAEVAA